jgi:predicted nucleic acid-binding protein
MIVLDTNVVSELMRKRPDSSVVTWIRKHRQHDARLATRNTADFECCGLRLINPWLD